MSVLPNLNETDHAETYVIGPAFDLPDLTALPDVDWVDHRQPEAITTAYFDTAEHKLARLGLTLYQQREGDAGSWFVASVGLRRTQLLASGPIDDTDVLRPALDVVLAGHELTPRLRVTTIREGVQVFDDDGETKAAINIDRVSAHGVGGRHLRRSWDTLSLSLPGDDADWADALRRQLSDRSAIPSADLQRCDQVLGVHLPERPRKLAGLVHDYLMPQLDTLLLDDIRLRVGMNNARGTRVAARRVLSVLRVMDDCFDAASARHLTTELSWFAGVLGVVTDCDMRRKRLQSALAGSSVAPVHGVGRRVVQHELDLDRQVALLTLADSLESPRYAALLDLVADWRTSIPFTLTATKRGKRQVRRYLDRAEAELETRLSVINRTPTDASMHAARIAARRTRFVAELAQPAIGREASLARSNALEIQDRLGEHRDAVITAELSHRLADSLDGAGREILMAVSDRVEHEVEVARKRSLSATLSR